jgi:NadR type nicotinamide-nucleotide adenylyltransferase
MEKRAAKNKKLIRIAITGPESTGKSSLTRQLAEHYKTVWVREFAREYIDNLNRPYNQDDIPVIAKNQLMQEEVMVSKANKILFCDTELIVTKVWSEFKYNFCDSWILENIETHVYDFYLLCNIDLPWEYDPQREHPDLREKLFNIYLRELQYYSFPYAVISGINQMRLKNAIKEIDKIYKSINN